MRAEISSVVDAYPFVREDMIIVQGDLDVVEATLRSVVMGVRTLSGHGAHDSHGIVHDIAQSVVEKVLKLDSIKFIAFKFLLNN